MPNSSRKPADADQVGLIERRGTAERHDSAWHTNRVAFGQRAEAFPAAAADADPVLGCDFEEVERAGLDVLHGVQVRTPQTDTDAGDGIARDHERLLRLAGLGRGIPE
jgi:hypothetical protein